MLQEQRRQQLDGIVQKMAQNKESDSNIRFVVDDFKSKYAHETEVSKPDTSVGFAGTKILGEGLGLASSVPMLKESDIAGQGQLKILSDRLKSGKISQERYNQLSQGLRPDISGVVPGISNLGESKGNLVRGAVKAGTDIASLAIGGGGAPGVVKATLGGAVKQGAVQGLKSGTTSGAMLGLGQGTEENQGVWNTIKKTIGGGAVGGIAGGVVGGTLPILGKTVNRLTPKGREAALASKNQKHALDLVSPKATSEVSERAIREGRVTEPSLLKRSKITPSSRDQEMANAIEDVVSPKKSVLQNTDAIDKKIRQINNAVKEYAAKNKVPFNTNQLRSKLNSGREELKLIFASDANAAKTYDAVVDEFMRNVGKKDTAGLLDARQGFDKIPAIRKLLDSQGLGENVKKEVVLTARRKANEYIAELLPEGNPYRKSLLQETRMIEALENIAEKNRGMIGKNNLQILAQRYPILKWVIGGVATGIAGGAGVGVGSTIINSSD